MVGEHYIFQKENHVTKEKLRRIVPENQRQIYDMEEVIRCIVDHSEYLKVKDKYEQEMITAFARLEGEVVGVIAN